jgi:hypothetical protein
MYDHKFIRTCFSLHVANVVADENGNITTTSLPQLLRMDSVKPEKKNPDFLLIMFTSVFFSLLVALVAISAMEDHKTMIGVYDFAADQVRRML